MNILKSFYRPSVAVVIPVYKSYDVLSKAELFSLKRCLQILFSYPIIIVCPEGLDMQGYKNLNFSFRFERFDPLYFENVHGYNKLMLSQLFYKRLNSFKFILIYQLDAFVFKDSLAYWCKRGYDYIGAPWLTDHMNDDEYIQVEKNNEWQQIYKENRVNEDTLLPVDEQFYNRVGNGGFSLRKTNKMIEVLNEMPDAIRFYLEAGTNHVYNEDVFWSLEANREVKRLNIPDYKEAVNFSIEFMPELGFKLMKGHFPFGCHDWDSYLPFWENKFKEIGVKI